MRESGSMDQASTDDEEFHPSVFFGPEAQIALREYKYVGIDLGMTY